MISGHHSALQIKNQPHSGRRSSLNDSSDLPNPQNPYGQIHKSNNALGANVSPNKLSARQLSLRKVMPGLPPLKETNSYFYNPQQEDFNTRSQISYKQMQESERLIKFENILESFLSNSLLTPYQQAIEETMTITLNATTVTLWLDIPSLHMLYSPRLAITNSHNQGLVGFTFFAREIVKSEHASSHQAYSEDVDGKVCPGTTPVLLFPLWDAENNVCGVVECTKQPKDEFFNEQDEEFILFFTKRFKIYSSYLFKSAVPHTFLNEMMRVMELEQFLLLFQQRVPAFFKCKRAEIWSLDMRTHKLMRFTDVQTDFDSSKCGIVGEALQKECPLNTASNKMMSSYEETADGKDDEAVLAVPIVDVKRQMKWAIVLRGPTALSVFTTTDENSLREISTYLTIAFDNADRFTEAGHGVGRTSLEHQCITNLQKLVKMLDNGEPIADIVKESISSMEKLTNADRSFLFRYDKESEQYVSTVHQTKVPVTIPKDKGIIGKTFQEKQFINVPEVYENSDFDISVDIQTGYKTKTLLSAPVLNNRREVVAVAQLANRKDMKPFSNIDIGFVQIFSCFCGLILENTDMYETATRATSEVDSFVKAATSLASDTTVRTLLKDILTNIRNTIGAERCSLFLLDEVVNVLTTFIADGDKMPMTIPLSHGIGAAAASTKSSIKVNDAYHDPRFNKMIDFHSGYKTRSIIAVPVITSSGKVVGVIEMINKQNQGVFTDEETKLIESFATFTAMVLETRRLKDITERGTAQIEMSKWIGEYERTSYKTPVKLQIPKNKQEEIHTLNFFAIDWNGIGLFKIVFYVFDGFGLLEQFKITNELFFTFLYKLREKYNEPPYHNWIHAIDVLQYVSYQVRLTNSDQILTKFELLAVCVAAICHDAGHEGYNNVFNVNAQTPLGILFKDKSVMETYHCTVAINIIRQPEANIFHSLNEQELRIIWKWIIHLILATDMAFHFKLIKQANEVLEQGALNLKEEVHRLMAMELIMKVSDISNVSRPFTYADRWCEVLNEEFWRQGDKEKELGFEFSSDLMDREGQNKAKGQVSFYQFVCLPLYTLIARIFPELQVNLDSMKNNLEHWKAIVAEQEAAAAAARKTDENTDGGTTSRSNGKTSSRSNAGVREAYK